MVSGGNRFVLIHIDQNKTLKIYNFKNLLNHDGGVNCCFLLDKLLSPKPKIRSLIQKWGKHVYKILVSKLIQLLYKLLG